MRAFQLRMMYIYISCVFSVLSLLPPEVLGARNSLIRNVGQDVVFMWNRTSGSIDEVRWGLVDDQGITLQFIYVNRFANVPVYSAALDTPAGSNYKGRVYYVGNVPAGRAWFKITNLSLSDTNDKYAVRILEGSVFTTYKMSLTVAAIPKFQRQPPLTKNIAEGQDLSVPCTAVGPPTPNVKWVQIVGHVTKSTGTGSATLRMPNIRRDQNGTYECQAWNNPNERSVTAQTVVTVYYPPQATLTSASITVVQGDDISLSCTADGYPPPSISWTKADGVIKAGHTVAGGTLRIPDAIKTDAGKYICTAKNTYGSKVHTDNATTTVVVKYQPSIISDKFPNRRVNETESLSIKCYADGYPLPTIKWKTPTGYVHTGNVYNIPSVSRSHAGIYTCTASNGIGREAMASIQVNVQFKPIIDESQSLLQTISWNGNSIRLRCFATSLPPPLITWYKPTNQQITRGVNIVPGGSEVTVLTTTDQGDYGQYKCRATNILGKDEHFINVTQLFPPGVVPILITELEASSFFVKWTKPAADGGLAVTDYLMEVSTKPPLITVNTHAVITGLKANTQYTVKVYPRNIVGYGAASEKPIRTKTKGKPPIPQLLAALLERKDSKLSVVLRWSKPDDNGGNITHYTIYMKEVKQKADWIKNDDVNDPHQVGYRVTKNIVYGKIYMFMVTAWNKYGESVKDEKGAKTVNTTADEETATNAIKYYTEEESKFCLGSIVLGVIIAILILSLGFNVLQFLYRRSERMSGRKERPEHKRKTKKEAAAGESYENDLALEDKITSAVTTSHATRPAQTGSEYESIQQPNLNKAGSSNDTSNYQGLNLLSNTSSQGTHGPVYEPLRTRSVEPTMQLNDNDQHPYEPLNIRNQNPTYQSLQGNSMESAIQQ